MCSEDGYEEERPESDQAVIDEESKSVVANGGDTCQARRVGRWEFDAHLSTGRLMCAVTF